MSDVGVAPLRVQARIDDQGVLWIPSGALPDESDLGAGNRQAARAARVAAGIAHDSNNTLTVVLGNAQLLGDDDLAAAERRVIVGEIVATVRSSSHANRDLLWLSRRDEAAPRRADLRAAISDVQKLLRRIVDPPSTLEIGLEPAACIVACDRATILQAVFALVWRGAAALAASGGGRLLLTVAARDDAANIALAVQALSRPAVVVELTLPTVAADMAAEAT